MKWTVCVLILLVAGCTTGQLEQAAGTMDKIADPNVIGMITDVNNVGDVAQLVTTVGTLVGSVKVVLTGGIIASIAIILAAFKKRK